MKYDMLVGALLLDAVYIAICEIAFAFAAIAARGWRKENARAKSIAAFPQLSPEAVAILCEGRRHFLWVKILQHRTQSSFAPTPQESIVGRILSDGNADKISWRERKNPELNAALTELRSHKLWAPSAANVGNGVGVCQRLSTIVGMIAMLYFVPLWFINTVAVVDTLFDIDHLTWIGAGLGWFIWILIFYPLFAPIRMVDKYKEKWVTNNPDQEIHSLPGVYTGLGLHYRRSVEYNFNTRSVGDEQYLTAIHGTRYLECAYPNLVRDYEWVVRETFDAEARERLKYAD